MGQHAEYAVRFSSEDRQWVATTSLQPVDSPSQDSERYLGPTAVEALVGLIRLLAQNDAEVERMACELFESLGSRVWAQCTDQRYWHARARTLIDAGWHKLPEPGGGE